jgi:flagellar biosynthesis/type III secretory pathway protein FliH
VNTITAKSFSFPARNKLDALEREASTVRNSELAAKLADAIARGYAEGLTRGREEAKAEANEQLERARGEGIERGQAEGLGMMNAAAEAMRSALGAFDLERAKVVAEAEAFCVDLALAIVGRIVEADNVQAEFARRSTVAALKALAPEPPTAIFLNPADLKSLGKAMSGLPLHEDETLARGASRVEAGRLLIESSIDEAFTQTRSAVIEIKAKRTGQKPEGAATKAKATAKARDAV